MANAQKKSRNKPQEFNYRIIDGVLHFDIRRITGRTSDGVDKYEILAEGLTRQ